MANKREAMIIVPKTDNDGESLELLHIDIEHHLCATFGGFTATDVRGGWLDNGKVYRDTSVAYTILVSDGWSDEEELFDAAQWLAFAARQEVVYLRLPTGEVHFVTEDNETRKWGKPPTAWPTSG